MAEIIVHGIKIPEDQKEYYHNLGMILLDGAEKIHETTGLYEKPTIETLICAAKEVEFELVSFIQDRLEIGDVFSEEQIQKLMTEL